MTDFKPQSTPVGDAISPTDSLGVVLLSAGEDAAGHQEVLALTERLFGQRPSLAVEIDPELGTKYIIVTASAHGSVEEIVALNDRWHREVLLAAAERADQYCLAIDTR